jgi:hypothetical protein
MPRKIDVEVIGFDLRKDNGRAGVRGEANASVLRIRFDESWDGFAKSVTFVDALRVKAVKRMLTADLLEDSVHSTRVYVCPIPGEAMSEAGMMEFVIDGWRDGNPGTISRTVGAELEVLDSPDSVEAELPVDPTPDIAEQLQAQVEALYGYVDGKVTEHNGDSAAHPDIRAMIGSGGGSSTPGEDGATFTPSVSPDGLLSWTCDQDLEVPAPVQIKPVKGVDYNTDADKNELVQAVLAALPNAEEVKW